MINRKNTMDFFGIGQAILGCLDIYFRAARSTGRTNSLINTLKDGDRVICKSPNEARDLRKVTKHRGMDIEVFVCDPKHFHYQEIATGQKKTYFEHTFIEAFHLNNLEKSISYLAQSEIEMSGYGEPHRETKVKAETMSKWQF